MAITALFVLPGWGWGRILVPTATTPLARIGRTVVASLLITSAGCTLLAAAGVLLPGTVLLMSGVAFLSGNLLARRLPSPPRTASMSRRLRRAWAATIALVAAAAVLILLPSSLRLGPELIPASSTVWYYAHLAHETAALGRFPSELSEWGTSRPFQTDYAPFTAHSAAAFQLMSNDLLVGQEVYRLVVLALVLLFATLLLRRFVSTWVAALGAVLLVTTTRLDFKLLAYKPEMFAFAAALAAVWLADRAATERSPRLAVVAMLLATLVFLAHAEVFLVLAALLGAIAVVRGPLRVTRGAIGLRPRSAFAGSAIAVVIVVGAGILGVFGNAAIAGEFRLIGYVAGGDEPTTEPLEPIPITRIPSGWSLTGDPTWDFYVAAAAPGEVGSRPPERFTDRRILPRQILHVWPGLDGRGPEGLVLLSGLVGAPFLAWPWLDGRRRRLLLIAAVFAIALLIGSWILTEISSTYVPRRAGGRRLMPYELMLPVIAAVCWLWATQRLVAPGWRALLRPKLASTVGALALAVVVTAAVAPARADEELDEAPGLSSLGLQTYSWIRDSLPADARILANAYTDGAMTALTERVSILDGRAVYLEDAAFLNDATRLVLGARRYFEAPASPSAASFLDEVAADYLLVVGPGGRGADVGGYRPFPTDYAELATSRRLTETMSFGDGRLTLYRIEGDD